jgi:hypothetical protein
MEEPIDVYSDQFQFNVGPYGCNLNFMVTDPVPPAPGSAPQARRLASVRMSVEHLKVMTFILHQQITVAETQTGVRTEIPSQVLNSLHISREDWDAFWRST